jgi:hypothetical protein
MSDFPEVPEELAPLSDEELETLGNEIQEAIIEAGTGDVTPAVVAEMSTAAEGFDRIRAHQAERALAIASLAADRDALLERVGFADEAPADPAADEEATTDVSGEIVPCENCGPADELAAEVTPPQPFNIIAPARQRPTVAELNAEAPETDPSPVGLEVASMRAMPGVRGYQAGQEIGSWTDLAAALIERHRDVGEGGSGEKFPVASIQAHFPEDRVLSSTDAAMNNRNLGVGLEGLTAAMCAPVEPYYGLSCQSSTMRPVLNSLGRFLAPRGGVTVYPNPKLADVVNGRGLWTRADDANPSAEKLCAVIPCDTPNQWDIYGVWKCLTVTNMNAMTFPELVEAFLNRLTALQSRIAEIKLMDLAIASPNAVALTADADIYGATTGLMAMLDRLVALYREQERYDDMLRFDAWMPRWARNIIREDLIRQNNDDGGSPRIVTNAEIDMWFSSIGIDINWMMDTPTTGTLPPVVVAGALPEWPTDSQIIVTPKGNLRALDGGRLDIGVTPNNIYRDNESNRQNNFTMFFESFEGLIDFGCDTWVVDINNFCPSGRQPLGVTAAACA